MDQLWEPLRPGRESRAPSFTGSWLGRRSIDFPRPEDSEDDEDRAARDAAWRGRHTLKVHGGALVVGVAAGCMATCYNLLLRNMIRFLWVWTPRKLGDDTPWWYAIAVCAATGAVAGAADAAAGAAARTVKTMLVDPIAAVPGKLASKAAGAVAGGARGAASAAGDAAKGAAVGIASTAGRAAADAAGGAARGLLDAINPFKGSGDADAGNPFEGLFSGGYEPKEPPKRAGLTLQVETRVKKECMDKVLILVDQGVIPQDQVEKYYSEMAEAELSKLR